MTSPARRWRSPQGPADRGPRRHALGTLLPFAATLLVSFGFAFGPGRDVLERTAPGLLWMATLFSAVMAARRSYQTETEDDALEGSPRARRQGGRVPRQGGRGGARAARAGDRRAADGGRAVRPVAGEPFLVLGAFALGTVGLAAVGGLFGVVAEADRTREAVFPMLVLPLVTPVLIAGVRATDLATTGQAGEGR